MLQTNGKYVRGEGSYVTEIKCYIICAANINAYFGITKTLPSN